MSLVSVCFARQFTSGRLDALRSANKYKDDIYEVASRGQGGSECLVSTGTRVSQGAHKYPPPLYVLAPEYL